MGHRAFRSQESKRRPLIVDTCLLFNEIDLLEIRLGELWDVVDRFVVVESDRTYAGHLKPFFFEEFSSVFQPFASKITYRRFIDRRPQIRATTAERMEFEAAQRNAIGTALEQCGLCDEDFVVLCDVDEIPRPSLVASLPVHLATTQYCIFVTRNYRGYVNNASASALNRVPWLGPVACRWKTFRTVGAQEVRRGEGRASDFLKRKDRRWTYLDDAGWHLSSMGGAEAFWVKAQNFSHVEDRYRVVGVPAAGTSIRAFTGSLSRQDCVDIQSSYLDHGGAARFFPLEFERFQVEQDLPRYLLAHKERFRRLFFFTDILASGSTAEGPANVASFSSGGSPVPGSESKSLDATSHSRFIGRLLKAIVRRITRPGLHRPRQYRPRKLVIPHSYHREQTQADPPSFAMVTPSYNQAQFIRATIDSVLAQRYPRLRYMVLDGNSSDETLSILSSYGDAFEWLSEPDGGQADAINKGFARIHGDIMGWLNSDDLLLPGALAYVARFFALHPEVDLVYGHRIYIDAAGLETGRAVLPPHDQEMLSYFNYIHQESLFWRSRVWARIGPLDTSLQFAMDWDFALRSAAAGFTFRRLPRFLGCLRSYSQQKTVRLASLGQAEFGQLRSREFKRNVLINEVSRAIRPYRVRQIAWQWGYRMGLPVS